MKDYIKNVRVLFWLPACRYIKISRYGKHSATKEFITYVKRQKIGMQNSLGMASQGQNPAAPIRHLGAEEELDVVE